ncbi:MAG: glutamate-cysteine ligase family protein [Candidatus Gracilibacteria bacterium]|nr:glutamate-cysteine ligase family protein [Candidatus Gracilibacteria bacterium]
MREVIVPEINHKGQLIKERRIYDTSHWVSGKINATIDSDRQQNGFEGEGFVIDNEGSVMIYSEDRFIPIDEVQCIETNSENGNSEQNLNSDISQNSENGLFSNGKAHISQELYLPCIEFSFDKGYGSKELFENIINTYSEIMGYLGNNGLLYLPSGNMPITTKNYPNLANEYYKYLFEARDGYDIAYFRGAGFQLHKEMDNYELAVYTYNKIRHLLPMFLTLSENSPLSNNEYHGNLSERISTKCDWKMTGIPESINNDFLSDLQRWLNSTIKTVTPYYFAVRYPRVDINTIENCAMDTVSDIPLMCALTDLYYRLTEKLKMTFVEGGALPREIFGDNDESGVETHVIRENYHRSIRYGTDVEFTILGNGNIGFKEYMGNVYRFIEDIPSIFPENISDEFGYSKTDATQSIINEIIDGGNLAEKTLKDLGIAKKMPINPISVNESEIRRYLLHMSENFRNQINLITNNH